MRENGTISGDHQEVSDSENKNKSRDEHRRLKLFLHGILCFTSFSTGWTFGMSGPVFPDLLKITGVDAGAASVFVSSQFAGSLIGSILGGRAIDRYNKYIVMATSSLCFGCTSFIIPLCSVYWAMILVFGIQGLALGMLYTGNITICGQSWSSGASSRSYLQSLMFCTPLGSILSPLVTAPFLSSDKSDSSSRNITETSIMNNTLFSDTSIYDSLTVKNRSSKMLLTSRNHTFYNLLNQSNQTTHSVSGSDVTSSDQRLIIPFSIAGALFLVTTVLFLVMFCQRTKLKFTSDKDMTDESGVPEQNPKLSLFIRIVRLYLIGQCVFLTKGCETTFAQFFPAFLHNKMGWTKILSSDIMSVFWGLQCFGRLGGIFVSYHVESSSYLFFNMTLIILSLSLLLGGMHAQLNAVMWVSSALTGLGYSTNGACILNWSHTIVLSRSGKHNSFLFVCFSLGSIVFPLIVGNAVVFDYKWVSYITLGISVLMLVNHVCLFMFVRRKLTQVRKGADMQIRVIDGESKGMIERENM